MFTIDTEIIFQKAGITKEEAPELFSEINAMLSTKMAMLSVTLGLSFQRIEIWEKQKQTFIEDLIKMKAAGELR